MPILSLVLVSVQVLGLSREQLGTISLQLPGELCSDASRATSQCVPGISLGHTVSRSHPSDDHVHHQDKVEPSSRADSTVAGPSDAALHLPTKALGKRSRETTN